MVYYMNLKRTFCTLSGDDYSIISQCDEIIQKRFIAIGGFVLIIFLLCFVSSYFTFTMLFKNYFIGLTVGLFFSWMITNIYLLLLYTLSKNLFPCISDKASHVFSISVRVIFICFIAIIVSKPIETILFAKTLESEVEGLKQQQINSYMKFTTEYYDAETKKLSQIISRQKALYNNSETSQIDKYENLLQKKESQRDKSIASMMHLVRSSNYYIKSIIILNRKYKACWFITFFTMFIFLFPAYLKNFIGEQSFYYETKRSIEIRLVKEEYASFKTTYNSIFQEHWGTNVQFSESFIDPPFNTIRKKDEREFLKEDDLISDLYHNA